MAKCEEGYLCDVCGGDVEELTDSDLYLHYVIGQLDPETLHTTRERHIRCNPVHRAVHRRRRFSAGHRRGRIRQATARCAVTCASETLVTRGYRRLKELTGLDLPIIDYPLPEVRAEIEREHAAGRATRVPSLPCRRLRQTSFLGAVDHRCRPSESTVLERAHTHSLSRRPNP